ncbi:PilN domain-containing protein [Roseateles sp.]|uniref:PilN domain-containing protein n=1 Tax=Roseateles sp. TaxID=1971397 RepID=UPI00286B044B|nr:PilN domain-containing protein [Roseateles sp.]
MLFSAGALLALGWRWHDLQGQRAVLAEQAVLLNQVAAADARGAGPEPLAKAADLQRRAWALQAQLKPKQGEDWASRWLAVEQALPPGLQLQALEMEGASLRLEGLAAQADAVMQLVDRLATQASSVAAGPAQEVVLTRLQRPEGSTKANEANEASESNALRFEVVRRRTAGQRS